MLYSFLSVIVYVTPIYSVISPLFTFNTLDVLAAVLQKSISVRNSFLF